MRFMRTRLALSLAVGVASVGLFGAAALAAFGPELGSSLGNAIEPGTSSAAAKDERGGLKKILDGLVTKAVITQAQEDAILLAIKDSAPTRVKAGPVLRDLFGAAAQYLGIPEKELHSKLSGTSLSAVARATQGKTREGLVAALAAAANADIVKALADKRITEDQAKTLRDGLAGRIDTFVDRTWPAKAAGRAPNIKSVLGDMLQTAQTYLGISRADIATALRAGKSLGDIANTTPNKSRDALVAALTAAANTHIDEAVTSQRLTADQAKTLKDKLAAEITRFVDRKAPAKKTKSP